MHSCRPWFFSRVFVLQRPKQLLPTHIVEHTEEDDTDPSHGCKQGWGSCKQFQRTLGTNTLQPHKRTALFGLAGLFHQSRNFAKTPPYRLHFVWSGFFHVLVGRNVCGRESVVCSVTQFLWVVRFCKGLFYIKNSNNKDQQWLLRKGKMICSN